MIYSLILCYNLFSLYGPIPSITFIYQKGRVVTLNTSERPHLWSHHSNKFHHESRELLQTSACLYVMSLSWNLGATRKKKSYEHH